MPLPDIFTEGTAQETKLASYFEEMYDYLMEEGVPEDRLPSPWHMLSRMVKCIDPELMRDWMDAYVAVESEVESESDEDEDEPERPQRPKMTRRPSYLRAIDDKTVEDKTTDDKMTEDPDAPEEGSQTDGS